ncbi:putative LTR retrotransposon, partial [Pseudoloma neurophilia]
LFLCFTFQKVCEWDFKLSNLGKNSLVTLQSPKKDFNSDMLDGVVCSRIEVVLDGSIFTILCEIMKPRILISVLKNLYFFRFNESPDDLYLPTLHPNASFVMLHY